jgi:hypothetical protein
MSINDALMNESYGLHNPPNGTASTASSSSSPAQAPPSGKPTAPEVQQALKVFERLEEYCVTREARRSLALFRNRWAMQSGMPFVAREIPAERRPSPGGDAANPAAEYLGKYGGLGSQDPERKISFMERLKMKRRKSSGRSEKSSGTLEEEQTGLLR